MTLFVLLLAFVCAVASKLNPTCGIGCDYLGSDSFAFNCESTVYHKGQVYNYASFMLACADKSCPPDTQVCKPAEGQAACRVTDSDVILSSYVCETPTGIIVKQGTKETQRTGEFWYYYTFTKAPVDAPSSPSVGGWTVLGIGIGLIVGVLSTVLVCWIRRRRAEASFQR